MNYAKIVREAWNLTLETPKLKWLIFIPTFMAVFIFALKIVWQGFMYASKFEWIENGFSMETIGQVGGFLSSNGLWGTGMALIIITLIFMFIIPSWIDSTLILAVDHKLKTPDKYLSTKQKMLKAFGFYFRMFELNAVLGLVSILSIALFTATVFRFFNSSLLVIFAVVIGIYSIIALVINTLFSFAPYYLVVDDMPLGQALKKSSALVFLNLMPTLGILSILFLINFRVIVNILVILGVPIGIAMTMTFFNNSVATVFSIILGLALFALAAYITSITTVFMTAVWIQAFETLKAKKARLEEGEPINQDLPSEPSPPVSEAV